MLDQALRNPIRERPPAPIAAASSGARSPALPVLSELQVLLPGGLRRGSTVSVTGSLSLLLALLAEASAEGAWCVLVDLPMGSTTRLGAEAARDFGLDLSRLPVVPAAGESWTNVVGALLDAFDIVAARAPAQLADGDLRRLAARARSRESVLLPFLAAGARWPMADLRLRAEPGEWIGIGEGHGRLTRRQMRVSVEGRGQAARTRDITLWLPGQQGAVEPYDDIATRVAPSNIATRVAPSNIATRVAPSNIASVVELRGRSAS